MHTRRKGTGEKKLRSHQWDGGTSRRSHPVSPVLGFAQQELMRLLSPVQSCAAGNEVKLILPNVNEVNLTAFRPFREGFNLIIV